MTITRYEYPLPSKFAKAAADVAPGFLRDAQACIQWLNLTPESPYSPDLLERMTGSRLGVEILEPPRW
jgi:hypothetical protein